MQVCRITNKDRTQATVHEAHNLDRPADSGEDMSHKRKRKDIHISFI
jgi:hypothetical protein